MTLRAPFDLPPDQLLARDDEIRALDAWIEDDEGPEFAAIVGRPGVGKGSLLSKWTAHRKSTRDTERVISYAIQRGEDPAAIVLALIELCVKQRDATAEPPPTIDRAALARALQEAEDGSRRLIVALDGLDEAADPSRLVHLLPSPLPPNVRLVATSRPPLDSRLRPGLRLDLDDAGSAASNASTCRAFWERRRGEAPWLSDAMIAAALRAGEGNMLHADLLWELWRSVPDERGAEPPRGLDGVFRRTWRHMEGSEELASGLLVLALAREPLRKMQIAELAGWPQQRHRELSERLVAAAEPLLHGEANIGYSLRHGVLSGLIRDHFPALDTVHQKIVAVLKGWLTRGEPTWKSWAARNLLHHCALGGSWREAAELCLRRDFCEDWVSQVGVQLGRLMIGNIAAELPSEETARLGRLARALALGFEDGRHEREAVYRGVSVATRPATAPSALKILFASANPRHTRRIRVGREFRRIREKLAAHRQLETYWYWDLTFGDLRQALLETDPDVVHLSCHGESDGSLHFESETDEGAQAVAVHNLWQLLGSLGQGLRLVVFNACHSAAIARRAPPLIDHCIGMEQEIQDDEAIEFAAALYGALARGLSIQSAFDAASSGLRGEVVLWPPGDQDITRRRFEPLVAAPTS